MYCAKESDDGKITDLFTGGGVLEKLAWYETNSFHWMLIWGFILVFLSGCIVSTLALTRFPGDSWHQLAQLLAGVTCGLNLVCAFGDAHTRSTDQKKLSTEVCLRSAENSNFIIMYSPCDFYFSSWITRFCCFGLDKE